MDETLRKSGFKGLEEEFMISLVWNHFQSCCSLYRSIPKSSNNESERTESILPSLCGLGDILQRFKRGNLLVRSFSRVEHSIGKHQALHIFVVTRPSPLQRSPCTVVKLSMLGLFPTTLTFVSTVSIPPA